jgi:predicted MPP superfamily phosphohydrolase
MITISLREVVSLLFFMLVLLFVCGTEALLLTDYALGKVRRRPGKPALFASRCLVLHAAVILGLSCLLYGHFVEPTWIDVHTTTIRTPKLKEARFRLVQITDLHCDKKARNEEAMVRIINSLKPDVVVATGDYLNHKSALPRLQDALQRLEAPLGKFAVTGNLDLRNQPLDVLDATGFRRLNRETVSVAKGTDSVGISGLDFARSDAPIGPIKALVPNRFNVFLFHTPDLIEDVCGPGVDLYLCGHTHGGQVCLPWYGALITFSKFGKKYESGLYHVGGTTLYVNRGLGLEMRPGPQVRFLARPEIAVFDIVPEPQ